MLPLILFFGVVAVGVLGLVAMLALARQHFAAWRHERALAKMRAARLIETARVQAEHAQILAKSQARPLPRAAAAVSLTQVFSTLEQSAEFERSDAVPVPRTRLAKGSVPIPMSDPRPVVPGGYRTVLPIPTLPVANARMAPLAPVVSERATAVAPRRAARSIPPPIPAFRTATSSGRR
jgi:hypothetical protein